MFMFQCRGTLLNCNAVNSCSIEIVIFRISTSNLLRENVAISEYKSDLVSDYTI